MNRPSVLSHFFLTAAFAAIFARCSASYHNNHGPAYKPCYSKCRFRFCDNKTVFKVGKYNDRSFTSAICSRYSNKIVGHVDSTGEAYLIGKYYYATPISKYCPYDLKQKFSPSFFKSFNVNKYYGYTQLSGVGHETPQQNQAQFLHNKCWALPLTAYQVLGKHGYVIDNKHPRSRPLVDCVAFKTIL